MKRNLFNLIIVFILSGLLASCGSSGGGDKNSNNNPEEKIKITISGLASKGPINNGTVKVYALDADGTKGDVALATTTTGPDGNFSVDIGSYTGNILIKVIGGTYTDEATGAELPNPGMRAILKNVSGNVSVVVTPLTEISVRLAESAGGLTPENIDKANAIVSALIVGVDITATTPVNVRETSSATGTNEQKNYGLLLAAISEIVASGNAADVNDAIKKITDDLADSKLDTTGTIFYNSVVAVINNSTINQTGLTLNDSTIDDNISNVAGGTVYIISGRVTEGDTGLSNVTITLSGVTSGTTTTDTSGNYTFTGLQNGSYTVTPSKADYTFNPASANVTVNGENKIQDFSATYNPPPPPTANTISGIINYGGEKTGRIYIEANWSTGTSIAGPGPFTIRGVQPGTYTLHAYMDHLGTGARNASNPTGNSESVVVTSEGASGVVITLTDPTPPTPITPTDLNIHPANGSVFIFWDEMDNDYGDEEIAEYYTIEWGTSPSLDTTEGSVKITAMYNFHYLHSGLTNGDELYYRISAGVGTNQSAPSDIVGPISIGPGTGPNTVSGTVTFPGTATGPLYVGLYQDGVGIYFTQILSPTSGESYSISGVPNGTFFLFAIVDNNNDGVIGIGDISNVGGGGYASIVTVDNTDLTGQAIVLTEDNAHVNIHTEHNTNGTDHFYGFDFEINTGVKMPVNVTMISGPNFLVPMDFRKDNGGGNYDIWMYLGETRPTVGDKYKFEIEYSDGTSEILTREVTGVVDDFAIPVDPSGDTCGPDCLSLGGTPTTPTLHWTLPPSPDSYTYFVYINGPTSNGWIDWYYPDSSVGMPSAQTSVQYNIYGSASQPYLEAGETYYWQVTVQDANGNRSVSQQVEYTPALNPVTSTLVGSWYVGTPGQADNFDVITFFNNGTYMLAADHDTFGNDVQDGIEYGAYTWDPITGDFTAEPTLVDTEGPMGWFSDYPVTLTGIISNDILSLFYEGVIIGEMTDAGGAARLATDVNNPIVGTWYGGNPGDVDDLIVITFFDNGTYVIAKDGEVDSEFVQDGMEHGAYTWDPETGAFTADASFADSNGDWGFNNIVLEDNITITISGDTLTVTVPGEGDHTAVRLVP